MHKIHLYFLDNIYDFLFFLYLVLKPVYIFPSGLPQISDFVLLLLFILLLSKKSNLFICRNSDDFLYRLRFFWVFIIWISFINIVCCIYYLSFDFIKPVFFYFFNFMSMYCVYKYYLLSGDLFLSKFSTYFCLSCILQGVISFVLGASFGRATVFFNNPNQLGLYALICFTTFLIFKKFIISKKIYYCGLFFSLYLILISLSKASIIGSLFIIFVYFVFYYKNTLIKIFLSLIIFIFILTGIADKIYLFARQNSYIDNAIVRIENISKESDSDLGSGRGYDRIGEIGFNVIWGVGEGLNNRFISLTGNEIHSSYASIVCYYGIIGFVILLYFIILLLRGSGKEKYLLIGIFLYGFSHQMLRNTLIWIMLAVICLYSLKFKKNY